MQVSFDIFCLERYISNVCPPIMPHLCNVLHCYRADYMVTRVSFPLSVLAWSTKSP